MAQLSLTPLIEMSDHNQDLYFDVTENEDGSMTLEWDHTHPVAIESGMNDWTQEMWIDFLLAQAELTIQEAEQEVE
jgi:polyisoprenoid-binding protein YceI